jgi:RNA polymerase sigma factor (sigma-70 family)
MPEEPPRPRDFASLYRATVAPLRRHLARILGNPAEAQDVAHDAYVKVWPLMESRQAEKPEALLYTAARRLAFNRLKRRRVSPFSASPAAGENRASPHPGVAEQVMARQEWGNLEAAIAALPPGCRSVLLLRKIELLSHQEIADRLGIAVSTVEKQHARALRLLRSALTEAPAEPSTAREARP